MAEELTPSEERFTNALHDLLDEADGAARAARLFTRVLLDRGLRVMMAVVGGGRPNVLTTITIDDVTEEVVKGVVERVLSRAGIPPQALQMYSVPAAQMAAQWAAKKRQELQQRRR